MSTPNTERAAIESTLADLAVSIVSERLPNLFDGYVGFELIKKNDEGTRAAGLLGFTVGKQLVNIPVMFLGGQVKGTEMIYIKEVDRFVAALRQWVEFIRTESMKDQTAPDVNAPPGQAGTSDMEVFAYPRNSRGKIASAGIEPFGYSGPDTSNIVSLGQFLRDNGFENWRGIVKTASTDMANVVAAMSAVHGPDFLKIDPSEFRRPKTAALNDDPGDTEDSEAEDVEVHSYDDDNAADLPPELKKTLAEDGLATVDRRKEESLNKVLTETRSRFFQPSENGYYEFMKRKGGTIKGHAFTSSAPIGSPNISSGPPVIIYGGKVWTGCGCCCTEGLPLAVSHVGDAGGDVPDVGGGKSLSVGKSYLAVDVERGWTSYVFKVTNKTGDKAKCESRWTTFDCCCDPVWVSVTSSDAQDKPVQVGDTVILPKNIKFVSVSEDNNDAEDLLPAGGNAAVEAALALKDVDMHVEKSASSSDWTLTSRQGVIHYGAEKDLYSDLVKKANLSGADALSLVRAVENGGGRDFTLKIASSFTIDSPTDVDDSAGSTQWLGVPQVTRTRMISKASVDYPVIPDPRDPASGMAEPQGNSSGPLESEAVAMRAATGGPQVFDPSMVAVMIRSRRVSLEIESEYLPKLMDSMDALCRLLLMFYWHSGQFSDIYGDKDMAEFEDITLSTIKELGRITLYLHRKRLATGGSSLLDPFSEND